ncbi:MAM and LDL-receptor class A domain-containing protein 2-like [Macrobrachium nipponense]|uniref:MAM and LDL-receptor class A domain-containing protein 2-like n=1 Tax=Macrobrachium nipponense TaxID=159736 RepID=UPI0030C7BB62
MFEGDKFATCVKGRWNGKIPKCITTGCDYYSSIPNGEAVYLYNEALVQFICNPGYVLEGSSALTCDGFGWNDTIPECKAPTDVEYFCDFESSSICGWSNGEHDEFDWTRNRGPSASFAVGTGPKADHTLGTIFGHYMYIEGSVPRSDGDRARLYSPVYPASFTESPTCFAFYYHMFGNTTGHLNIYMKGEEDNIEFQSPVYQMGGYNHDKWILQVVHLHELDSNFQLVLEGVRGHSYTSDIGIDDVKLAHGEDCDHLDEEAQKQYQTSAPETTRTTSPLPETTLKAEISTISSGGTESTAIISSSTDMSNDILVMGGSSTRTTESSTGSVSSTVIETTSAAFQTSGGYKLESSSTPGPILSTTTTAYSAFDPASDDDLSSCRNRCDEIAIDPGTCGCDIECAHNHTCCLDVEEFCEGYIITMPPPSPEPVATSTSPSVTNAVDSTVELTSAVTEPQSSTSEAPVMIITTVPATPEVTSTISTTLEITTREVTTPKVTTTTKTSTALEPLVTEMPTTSTSTEQTQTPLVTTDTSTKTTQQTTKSKPIVPKTPPPTTTLEPTTETTTETLQNPRQSQRQ